MKRWIFAVVVLLLVGGCLYLYRGVIFPRLFPDGWEDAPPLQSDAGGQQTPEDPEEETRARETAQSILQSMTIEEKVGQLFFVRCPEEGAVEKIGQYHLGGYLLFGRDFKDKTAQEVTDTLAAYQASSDIPLLLGVDEEGGTVVRVSSNPNLFPSKCLSPQDLYAQGGLEAIAQDAVLKNTTLFQLGLNVNFAPVADVSTDPEDFMYDRSFGQDAQATAEYVETVVAEMEAIPIGSVLKHFPGYGNNTDTHTGIALDNRSMDTFRSSDFLPFSAGIQAGADAVLVSHNVVIAMDGSLPASLSPAVHRLLREELGFDGVILTDDLAMEAVADYAADGSVAVKALQAGNDMVVTTDFETQIPFVLQAVEDGTLSQESIDQSVERVLMWKYHLGLL